MLHATASLHSRLEADRSRQGQGSAASVFAWLQSHPSQNAFPLARCVTELMEGKEVSLLSCSRSLPRFLEHDTMPCLEAMCSNLILRSVCHNNRSTRFLEMLWCWWLTMLCLSAHAHRDLSLALACPCIVFRSAMHDPTSTDDLYCSPERLKLFSHLWRYCRQI